METARCSKMLHAGYTTSAALQGIIVGCLEKLGSPAAPRPLLRDPGLSAEALRPHLRSAGSPSLHPLRG